MEARPVWLSLPDGYDELPLADIPETVDAARRLIAEVGRPEQQAQATAALGLLSGCLSMLAERNAIYCGIGQHASAVDGRPVSSSLVAAVLDLPGVRNPRLLLRDVLVGKARAAEQGQADVVDLPNGPAAFFEHTLLVPRPALAGDHTLAEGDEAPVWQLEAFVPSPAGDRLVTIEVSTPMVDEGPQFRAMVVAMAAALSFTPPPAEDPLAVLAG